MRTPLESISLLPIPGGGFPDLRPFVPVLEIDIADVAAIVGFDITTLKIDAQTEQVASRRVKLKHLIEEKTIVEPPLNGSGIRNPSDDWIACASFREDL